MRNAQSRKVYANIHESPAELCTEDVRTSNDLDDRDDAFWSKRKLVYVCCSKVGSTVVRSLFERMNAPYLYLRHNKLILAQERRRRHRITSEAREDEQKIRSRSTLFVSRCPYARFVSSFLYLSNERFDGPKQLYLESLQIDVNSFDPFDYIEFLREEIKSEHYNRIIEHGFPQTYSYRSHVFKGQQIDILWNNANLGKFIRVCNRYYRTRERPNKRRNVNVLNPKMYLDLYRRNPRLMQVVREFYSDDFNWLNPVFDYESKFEVKLKV